MPFPNSNLPSTSQPWARDVQKRVESLESNVKANEINNTARDVQLENNYKRIDKAVNDLIVADAAIIIATQQAQDAADDAAAAASTANSAATDASSAAAAASSAASQAQSAANTANSAIAILSSLTSYAYYPGTGRSWTTAPGLAIDYYGSTYIDIPESGGQRDVIINAVFDVDLQTATGAASTQAKQTATAYLASGVNSTASGGNRGTNTSNISVYGGGSLSVSGKYTVSSSGSLGWNPYLIVNSTGSGTFNGSAILRFVTVTITKV